MTWGFGKWGWTSSFGGNWDIRMVQDAMSNHNQLSPHLNMVSIKSSLSRLAKRNIAEARAVYAKTDGELGTRIAALCTHLSIPNPCAKIFTDKQVPFKAAKVKTKTPLEEVKAHFEFQFKRISKDCDSRKTYIIDNINSVAKCMWLLEEYPDAFTAKVKARRLERLMPYLKMVGLDTAPAATFIAFYIKTEMEEMLTSVYRDANNSDETILEHCLTCAKFGYPKFNQLLKEGYEKEDPVVDAARIMWKMIP
jgi:hypothetical protein